MSGLALVSRALGAQVTGSDRVESPYTELLRERGIEAADGREMLVQQGAAAFERFFPGVDAPVEVMRAAVVRALRG